MFAPLYSRQQRPVAFIGLSLTLLRQPSKTDMYLYFFYFAFCIFHVSDYVFAFHILYFVFSFVILSNCLSHSCANHQRLTCICPFYFLVFLTLNLYFTFICISILYFVTIVTLSLTLLRQRSKTDMYLYFVHIFWCFLL